MAPLVGACRELVRGIGLGVVTIPLMTPGFRGLAHDDIPDASIITRIAQQVGGSFDAAILAIGLATATARRTRFTNPLAGRGLPYRGHAPLPCPTGQGGAVHGRAPAGRHRAGSSLWLEGFAPTVSIEDAQGLSLDPPMCLAAVVRCDGLVWFADTVDPEPRKILDLGSGPGTGTFVLADQFPRASVTAADVSSQMLAQPDGVANRSDLELRTTRTT